MTNPIKTQPTQLTIKPGVTIQGNNVTIDLAKINLLEPVDTIVTDVIVASAKSIMDLNSFNKFNLVFININLPLDINDLDESMTLKEFKELQKSRNDLDEIKKSISKSFHSYNPIFVNDEVIISLAKKTHPELTDLDMKNIFASFNDLFRKDSDWIINISSLIDLVSATKKKNLIW